MKPQEVAKNLPHYNDHYYDNNNRHNFSFSVQCYSELLIVVSERSALQKNHKEIHAIKLFVGLIHVSGGAPGHVDTEWAENKFGLVV